MFIELRWQRLDSSQVAIGPQGISYVASGKSGLLSSCKGYLGICLGSRQGNRASSKLGTWAFSTGATVVSDLLSCCEGILQVPFESVPQSGH